MEVDKIGVHTSHCCPKCGCKYGDPECPVALGLLEAKYECEDCLGEAESLRETLSSLPIKDLQEIFQFLSSLLEERSNVGL